MMKEEDSIEEDDLGLDLDAKDASCIPDMIPWVDIEPRFHDRVRHLFVEKYPHVVSRGFFDCGDTSNTLGYVKLPYKADKTPPYPKIFPMPEKKRATLRLLLNKMVESGLARGPVNSNQGAPCFLIPRKDPTKPASLIVSLTRENACLVDPPQLVLPSTDKVLSKLCLLYTSPSPRDKRQSRMPSSA